jgi:hypothetical protein
LKALLNCQSSTPKEERKQGIAPKISERESGGKRILYAKFIFQFETILNYRRVHLLIVGNAICGR